MRNLLTALFTFCTMLVFADIPRVDIMEVTYQGKRYYTYQFVSHLIFDQGCFYSDTKEYLYEASEFFNEKVGYSEVYLSSELVKIPKTKLSKNLREGNESDPQYNPYITHLTGKRLRVKEKSIDSIEIVNIIIGNMVGYYLPSKISITDQNWINDYELEYIESFSDNELCYFELYSITGNISQKEAKGIKNEMLSLYYELRKIKGDKSKTPNDYINELLKRNILTVGFCGC